MELSGIQFFPRLPGTGPPSWRVSCFWVYSVFEDTGGLRRRQMLNLIPTDSGSVFSNRRKTGGLRRRRGVQANRRTAQLCRIRGDARWTS